MIPPLVLVVWIGRIPIVVPVVLLWPLLAVAWTSARIFVSLRGLKIDLRSKGGPPIGVRLY